MSILQIFQNSYTNYHRIQCFVTNTKYFKLSSLLIIPYPNKALLKSNQTPHKSPKPKFVFLSWQNTQKHSNTILLPPTFAAPEPNPKTKKPLQKAHIRCKKKNMHTRDRKHVRNSISRVAFKSTRPHKTTPGASTIARTRGFSVFFS